jgi:hypothetical protein
MGCPSSQERDIRMAELLENAFAKLPATPSPISPAPEEPATTSDAESTPPEVPTLSIIKVDPESDDTAEATPSTDEEPPTVEFKLQY